jgi:nitronate monooxygenase
MQGDVDEGVVFVGSNAWRVDKIVTVKALIEELKTDTERYRNDITISTKEKRCK